MTARRFRARFWPTLATVLLVPVFLALGYWQLQRADEKRALQAQYDARADGPAVQVEGRLQRPEELQFYRVTAKGRYETEYEFLLDNRVHHGQPGYHVITPLRIAGSDVRVLVNRGWIPLGEDRAHPPAHAAPTGALEITGVATVPAEKYFTLAEPAPIRPGQWPRVWQNLDLARYRAAVPFPVQPVVVLLDPAAPGGFAREWNRLDAGISVHLGYAFQWFLLAAVLAGLYVYLSLRRPSSGREDT